MNATKKTLNYKWLVDILRKLGLLMAQVSVQSQSIIAAASLKDVSGRPVGL